MDSKSVSGIRPMALARAASMLAGLVGFALGAFLTKPFDSKKPEAIQLIHRSVGDAEYSLPLLDKPQLNIA